MVFYRGMMMWIPITPGTITTRTVHLSQVRVDGPDTYWVEQRASQAGRNVLLRRDGDGQIGEILPLTPSDELHRVRAGAFVENRRDTTVKIPSQQAVQKIFLIKIIDLSRLYFIEKGGVIFHLILLTFFQ